MREQNYILDDSTCLKRGNETFWQELDREVVALDLVAESYYSMNETGSLIWKMLQDQEHSVDSICSELASVHDGDVEELREPVRAFLVQLVNAGLLDPTQP